MWEFDKANNDYVYRSKIGSAYVFELNGKWLVEAYANGKDDTFNCYQNSLEEAKKLGEEYLEWIGDR